VPDFVQNTTAQQVMTTICRIQAFNSIIPEMEALGWRIQSMGERQGLEDEFWILWERIPQPTTYPSEGL
jgi:hypothetical protein